MYFTSKYHSWLIEPQKIVGAMDDLCKPLNSDLQPFTSHAAYPYTLMTATPIFNEITRNPEGSLLLHKYGNKRFQDIDSRFHFLR